MRPTTCETPNCKKLATSRALALNEPLMYMCHKHAHEFADWLIMSGKMEKQAAKSKLSFIRGSLPILFYFVMNSIK